MDNEKLALIIGGVLLALVILAITIVKVQQAKHGYYPAPKQGRITIGQPQHDCPAVEQSITNAQDTQ